MRCSVLLLAAFWSLPSTAFSQNLLDAKKFDLSRNITIQKELQSQLSAVKIDLGPNLLINPNKGSIIYQLALGQAITMNSVSQPLIVNPDGLDDRTRALIGGKILLGDKAQPGQFPWQVALLRSDTGNLFCSGSHIGNGWIVTAAHCFRDSPTKTRLSREDFIVFHGSYNLTTGGHRTFAMADPLLHDQFDPQTFSNDIALIRIAQPGALPTAPLPGAAHDPKFVTAPTKLIISGWGQTTEGGNISIDLLQATIPVADFSKCKQAYVGTTFSFSDVQFCAGSLQSDGPDTCRGDSGGPITHFEPLGNERVVMGVTSFGMGCGHKEHPGVYTRLLAFIPWIDKQTKPKN